MVVNHLVAIHGMIFHYFFYAFLKFYNFFVFLFTNFDFPETLRQKWEGWLFGRKIMSLALGLSEKPFNWLECWNTRPKSGPCCSCLWWRTRGWATSWNCRKCIGSHRTSKGRNIGSWVQRCPLLSTQVLPPRVGRCPNWTCIGLSRCIGPRAKSPVFL
jgi:hypothetical protein